MVSRCTDHGHPASTITVSVMTELSVVHLSLERADQLISLERSLLTQSKLREDVGQWIVKNCARRPNQHAKKLIIHLPQEQIAKLGDIRQEIEIYFLSRRLDELARKREITHQAWGSAIIGVLFLIAVLNIAELLDQVPGHLADIMTDGLTVLAWVGLWRLTEEIVYEWYPITRQIRRFASLSKLDVAVMSANAYESSSTKVS